MLPPQSNWDHVLTEAKALLARSAEGAWSARSDAFFFKSAYFEFVEERDAALFKLHYSDLLSTINKEMEKRFSPVFRFADAYQEKRAQLVATKGHQAAEEELADELAVIQDTLEQLKNLRAATRI
jgi:non-homologous end joining protein Ku